MHGTDPESVGSDNKEAKAMQLENFGSDESERVAEALARDVNTLPLSYFFSPNFLG